MRKLTLASALALAAIASSALPALSAQARASGNAAVRDGPGSGYYIIDRLVDGRYYTVEECTRRAYWCFVSDDGYGLGWVRGSYLVGSGAKAAVTPFEFLVNPDFNQRWNRR